MIEHIQTRYHDAHRRALGLLVAQAGQLTALGPDVGLLEHLVSIGEALEQHMFKEEMRLFPMMEQGGNTLIRHLIVDLHREHGDHLPALQDFQRQLRAIQAAGPMHERLVRFIHGVDDFAGELAEHIRLEDEVLFPLFVGPAATGASTASIP